jgi:hypothetical protein
MNKRNNLLVSFACIILLKMNILKGFIDINLIIHCRYLKISENGTNCYTVKANKLYKKRVSNVQ